MGNPSCGCGCDGGDLWVALCRKMEVAVVLAGDGGNGRVALAVVLGCDGGHSDGGLGMPNCSTVSFTTVTTFCLLLPLCISWPHLNHLLRGDRPGIHRHRICPLALYTSESLSWHFVVIESGASTFA